MKKIAAMFILVASAFAIGLHAQSKSHGTSVVTMFNGTPVHQILCIPSSMCSVSTDGVLVITQGGGSK
jgi:hypothetical protein